MPPAGPDATRRTPPGGPAGPAAGGGIGGRLTGDGPTRPDPNATRRSPAGGPDATRRNSGPGAPGAGPGAAPGAGPDATRRNPGNPDGTRRVDPRRAGGPPPTTRVPPGGRPDASTVRNGTPPGPPRRGGPAGPGRGGRPVPGEARTDLLPPVGEPEFAPEPALLTHRDDDYLSNELPAVEDEAPRPRRRSAEDEAADKRRRIWKNVRRGLYVAAGIGFLVPVIGFIVLYKFASVPDPAVLAAKENQPVTVYYADNSVMENITSGTKKLIDSNAIPQPVFQSAMAAENETFLTDPGFDITAIIRSAYNNLTGGVGGGSTITQEYIKVATGNDQISLARKATEIAAAYKMTNSYNKQQIMAAYLNTVYFGRGATGIENASLDYFGVTPDKLSYSQAALLTGMINKPGSGWVQSVMVQRWQFVMAQLLKNHWISQQYYDANHTADQFPATLNRDQYAQIKGGGVSLSPTRQFIETQVFDELDQSSIGWSQQALQRNGAKIYTTINPGAQQDLENSVNMVMSKDSAFTGGGTTTVKPTSSPYTTVTIDKTEAAAGVSADPTTGGIIAYYGGDGSLSYDLAQTTHQPGSSFKPYVFAAGLELHPDKVGLNSIFDSTTNQTIDNQLVHNSEGEGGGPMSVWDAMTQSVNTVFYKMGADIDGTSNVRKVALQAGIAPMLSQQLGAAPTPSLQDTNGTVEGGISIGQYPVRVVDQAQGYATFASGGMIVPLHFVSKVTDNNGGLLYQFNTQPKQAFSSDPNTNAQIANTVTQSLSKVAQMSTNKGGFQLANNRPNGAKTGTQGYNDAHQTSTGYNSDAWTVGYTPQVVTAVWFGHSDHIAPIIGNYKNGVGNDHNYSVFGREEPAWIWQNYMDTYLANQPATPFNTQNLIEGGWNFMTNQPLSVSPPPSNTQSSSTSSVTQTQDTGLPTFTIPTFPTGGHHHTTTTDTAGCGLFCTSTSDTGGGIGNGGGGGGPGG